MVAQESSESALSPIRTDAAGAIDEDIYCLICGYNLRGLAGSDPVRCPECGNLNDLGTAAIPAEMIREMMRRMETSPTMCAACAFAACAGCLLAVVVVESPGGAFAADVIYPYTVPVAGFALLCWFLCCFRMRWVYEDRPGWDGILFDFHVATFCCSAGVPLLWLTVVFLTPAPNPVVVSVMVVVAAALFVLGLRTYRSAQGRIATLQRDAAVRMARNILRRRNTLEFQQKGSGVFN